MKCTACGKEIEVGMEIETTEDEVLCEECYAESNYYYVDEDY